MSISECQKIKRNINRIAGQTNGISKMIEDGREVTDIIIQINAVRAALARLGVDILKEESQLCLEKKGSLAKSKDFNVLVEQLFKIV